MPTLKEENKTRSGNPPHKIGMWFRKKAKTVFGLYDIDDLKIGGNCGCCGKWMPDEIFDKNWSWGLCEKCANNT